MTPEEKRQFEEMQMKIEQMENSTSLDHVQQMLDILVPSRPEVTDTDVDLVVSVSGGAGGNVTVLDFPDRWLNFVIDGETYRVGAWLEKNDGAR